MLLSRTLPFGSSQFGSIPPSGLGEDSVTDRWTDGGCMNGWAHGKMMLLSNTLTMRGSDVTGLAEIRPVVSEGIA